MKFRVLVALSITLLMVFTLVTPALAGSSKLSLDPVSGSGEVGTGTATLRATHDDYCKVSVVLQGASSYKVYNVSVYDGINYRWAGSLVTDADGDARFSGATYYCFPPDSVVTCQVALSRSDLGGQVVYLTNSSIDLNFK
jgi:hypothetical protein